jgi:hypothetical protein
MPAWPKCGAHSEFIPSEPDYPIRLSVRRGSGSQNEVIAARIAKEFHIDVPETYLPRPVVSVTEGKGVLSVYKDGREDFLLRTRKAVKTGSLQEFKPGTTLAGVTTFRQINTLYCKLYSGAEESAQVNARLMLFDFVCGNADRNLGNVLIDPINKKIYPIDHGLCFPDGLSLDAVGRRGDVTNETTFQLPFLQEEGDTISQPSLELCRDLNSDELAIIMREGGASESSIEEMKMRVLFVKILAEAGKNVGDMKHYFHFKEGGKSPLELIVSAALRTLGMTELKLKVMGEDEKRALFPFYLAEFERQAHIYLGRTGS